MALDITPKQEGGKLKAVASGTLPSGQPVVVNADGTVSVVVGASGPQAIGSPTVFEAAASISFSATYDASSQKVVIAYSDVLNSNVGTAIVGTVSGTSISFGSPSTFTTWPLSYISASYDASAQKVVIAYQDQGGSSTYYGTAIVGTVSGTSISFGTPVVFESAESNYISAVYDSAAQKIVISYRDGGNSAYGTSVVGTVSGTSISFGSPIVFESATCIWIASSYDSDAQRVVVAYRDIGNSSYGTAIVGTVSGTSISFGSPVVYETSTVSYQSSAYDSGSQKVVIAYQDSGNSNYGTAVVGTVSGTSISFGSPVVFEGAQVVYVSATYDANAQKVILAYKDSSSDGAAIVGTVSGTSISFGSPVVFENANTNHIATAYDSNAQKVVIAYQDSGNSNYGTSVVFQAAYSSTTLTSENYIGMSGGVVIDDSEAQAIGSEVVFESADTRMEGGQSAVFDNNSNKVVFVYKDVGNSSYGTAVVGTVSGTSISFGTPVVFESATTEYVSATFDSTNNKVVVVYSDRGNLDYGTAVVGTVSGTSISFGSPVVFESADSEYIVATFDSNSSKVVVAYHDNGNSSYGTAVVGTVSGTGISFGTPVVFEAADTRDISATFDSTSNKVVIAYKDVGNSNYGTAIVGTVSGTSISFGSAAVYTATEAGFNNVVFDPVNNKVVVAYQDSGNSSYGTAVVGTVSGTSISFGTAVVFSASSTQYPVAVFDNNAGKVVITYEDAGDSSKGKYSAGTISDTSITFDTAVLYSDGVGFLSTTYDSNSNKVVNGFRDSSNGYGTGIVIQPGFTDITRGQVADGDNATVDIVGTVSTNQVALTAGQQYYVQTDGTVGTTPADPSVLAGTAISATKMLVKT